MGLAWMKGQGVDPVLQDDVAVAAGPGPASARLATESLKA